MKKGQIKNIAKGLLFAGYMGFCSNAQAEPTVQIEKITFNQHQVNIGSQEIYSVTRGDDLDIEVTLKALADNEEISVDSSVDTGRINHFYSDSEYIENVTQGSTYKAQLSIEFSETNTYDEYGTHKIVIMSGGDKVEIPIDYNNLRHDIDIEDFDIIDKDYRREYQEGLFSKGDDYGISLDIINNGIYDETDISVLVSSQDLGISHVFYVPQISSGESYSIDVDENFRIPESAKKGKASISAKVISYSGMTLEEIEEDAGNLDEERMMIVKRKNKGFTDLDTILREIGDYDIVVRDDATSQAMSEAQELAESIENHSIILKEYEDEIRLDGMSIDMDPYISSSKNIADISINGQNFYDVKEDQRITLDDLSVGVESVDFEESPDKSTIDLELIKSSGEEKDVWEIEEGKSVQIEFDDNSVYLIENIAVSETSVSEYLVSFDMPEFPYETTGLSEGQGYMVTEDRYLKVEKIIADRYPDFVQVNISGEPKDIKSIDGWMSQDKALVTIGYGVGEEDTISFTAYENGSSDIRYFLGISDKKALERFKNDQYDLNIENGFVSRGSDLISNLSDIIRSNDIDFDVYVGEDSESSEILSAMDVVHNINGSATEFSSMLLDNQFDEDSAKYFNIIIGEQSTNDVVESLGFGDEGYYYQGENAIELVNDQGRLSLIITGGSSDDVNAAAKRFIQGDYKLTIDRADIRKTYQE